MPDGHNLNAPTAGAKHERVKNIRPAPVALRVVAKAAWLLSSVAPGVAARLLVKLFLTPQKNRIPARETQWLEGAKSWDIALDQRRLLPLYSWGKGPTVLLVHGFSGRVGQMGAFIAPLINAGYRVVAFDAPAHGRAGGKQTALPEIARAVARVADHLGPLAGCIAHSMGTAATTIALSRGMDCARVVYVAPPENMQAYLLRAAQFLGFTRAAGARAQARIEAQYGMTFESFRGDVLGPTQTVPALMFHDRKDAMVFFEDGEKLANCWPGARLIETQGLGHVRILRDPDVVRQTAEFLTA